MILKLYVRLESLDFSYIVGVQHYAPPALGCTSFAETFHLILSSSARRPHPQPQHHHRLFNDFSLCILLLLNYHNF